MKLKSILLFRKTSLTILLLLTILLIGVIEYVDENRYKYILPSDEKTVKLLDDAWTDLQNITYRSHPYGSMDNDRVHDYILNRVKKMINGTSFAEVHDDYEAKSSSIFRQRDVFNASSPVSRVIYFESSNILVKLQGKNPELPGLLLSAHFDSVPTSFGATDDGKGVVSIMATLQKLIENQPERTTIINFNNNEEFGLLGATVFFNHAWSKLVKYVINLEGTGIGGKAVLFRTTDTLCAKIYQKAVRFFPFGNSMYQQGFNNRMIGSETDYKVYSQHGLRGWDIAFYKPRNLYHTIQDSIQNTSKEALWNMLHTTLQLTQYIAFENFESEIVEDTTPAIFFDIVGLKFVAMSSKTLFMFNCTTLTLFAVINFFLLAQVKKYTGTNTDRPCGWWKLPVSIATAAVLTQYTIKLLQLQNPYYISRDYLTPIICYTIEFLTIQKTALWIIDKVCGTTNYKTVAINELFYTAGAYLMYENYRLYHNGYLNTGTYNHTIVFTFLSLCNTLSLIFLLFRRNRAAPLPTEANNDATAIPTHQIDERAPLLRHPSSTSPPPSSSSASSTTTTPTPLHPPSTVDYHWAIQYITLVPIPMYLVFHNANLILDATHQTIQETGNPGPIYTTLKTAILLLALPITPFIHKLDRRLAATAVAAAAAAAAAITLGGTAAPPFTAASPLKIRFHQSATEVSLLGINHNNLLRNTILDLPSVKLAAAAPHVHCTALHPPSDLALCRYPLPAAAHPFNSSSWLSLAATPAANPPPHRAPNHEPRRANLRIRAHANRMCTLRFRSAAGHVLVDRLEVATPDPRANATAISAPRLFRDPNGIDELQLHKLDFHHPDYLVNVQWQPRPPNDDSTDNGNDTPDNGDALNVDLQCYWTHDTQLANHDAIHAGTGVDRVILSDPTIRSARVTTPDPALHPHTTPDPLPLHAYLELLHYAPRHISIANREKGLLTLTANVTL